MFDERFYSLALFRKNQDRQPKPHADVLGSGLGEARVERLPDGRARRVIETGRLLRHPEKMQQRNEHIQTTWQELINSGIPTVQGLEFDKDPRVMYMEDLSRGGLCEVMSTPDFGKIVYKDETRKGKYYDSRESIKFTISNIDKLNQELKDLYHQLLEHSFHLMPKKDGEASSNMFYLVIDKQNQEGRILVWDLTRVKKEDIQDPETREQIATDNSHAFAKFVRKINQYLSETSQLEFNP